jgi:hypothetical protein
VYYFLYWNRFKNKSRGDILINSTDCPYKKKGELFDLIIETQYNATIRGINTNYTEIGLIKGPSEASC